MTNKQVLTSFDLQELLTCIEARNQKPFASEDLTLLYFKIWSSLTMSEPTTQQIEQFAKANAGMYCSRRLAGLFVARRLTPQWVAWHLGGTLRWFPPLRWLLFSDIKSNVIKMQGFIEGCHHLMEWCDVEHMQLNEAALTQYMDEIKQELADMGLGMVNRDTGEST